jgi:hypothetical protein
MSVNQRVAEWIKNAKRNGVNQVKLAGIFNVKPQYISELANEKGSCGLKIIYQILAFDKRVSARWLILGYGDMYDSLKFYQQEFKNSLFNEPETELESANRSKETAKLAISAVLSLEAELDKAKRKISELQEEIINLKGGE